VFKNLQKNEVSSSREKEKKTDVKQEMSEKLLGKLKYLFNFLQKLRECKRHFSIFLYF